MKTRLGNRKRGVFHRFRLIEPKENADSDKLADGLISLKPVEEVLITDGSYGLVVKVRFQTGKEPSNVTDFISRHIGSRFGTLDSCHQYRK
ncbi:MAG: hypothetical protein LVQ95_00200 [Candidatus Micrarchaeales archaeon]|nr:hypothetical protein [Candidatus Micrarchaeales archaeon]